MVPYPRRFRLLSLLWLGCLQLRLFFLFLGASASGRCDITWGGGDWITDQWSPYEVKKGQCLERTSKNEMVVCVYIYP